MNQKKNIIKIVISFLIGITITIEFGITIGYYMLTKINYNKYKENYNIEIVK